MKHFYTILSVLLLLSVLVGCKKKETVSTSGTAQITAFYLAANDSFPGMREATFRVEERLDTGLIYNLDSIRFGTPLERVIPKFTFAATPGKAVFTNRDTTFYLSSSDTVDLTARPVYITITSSNGKNTKVYEVRATVHQVDPDLFQWTCLCTSIPAFPSGSCESRALLFHNQMMLLTNSGTANRVFQTKDGRSWEDLGAPNGLASGADVRRIIADSVTGLWYFEANQLYRSDNGTDWTSQSLAGKTYTMLNLIGSWNNHIWAAIEDDSLRLAYYENEEWKPVLALTGKDENRFPVSDFAMVPFHNASGRARMLILGGFAPNGEVLSTRWSVEYATTVASHGGYRAMDFAIDAPTQMRLCGGEIIDYNHQLYLIGGVDENQSYHGEQVYVSNSEGLQWQVANADKLQFPESCAKRQKQSALVWHDNIYLIGGQSINGYHSDVWCGRLNSIGWDRR